ncbi:MAG: hypothetical protein JWN14_2379 [Chthonomonadales bacterium]|nr:hypothetical protein [Chthonomonadales bacterium]
MQPIEDNLISRQTFETASLFASHPPQFHHANKQILYDYVCSAGCPHDGHLEFTRWQAFDLPTSFRSDGFHTVLEGREGFFGYEPTPRDSAKVEWYLNFAHSNLFCAYGMGVFAQDEIQVAEHPALASLLEALPGAGIRPLTVEDGVPTPILIRGAERRCSVATDRNEEAGRPRGLYGRQFALATPETILQSTRRIEPPTLTNLIAMEAPSYGRGAYNEEQIRFILTTAFTGFSAACSESRTEENPSAEVIIHTGFWGCGAYGGNRVLMALLQLLAARWSDVDRLVFHIPDPADAEDLETARHLLEEKLIGPAKKGGGVSGLWQSLFGASRKTAPPSEQAFSTAEVIERIEAQGFLWGESDGN